uniref:Microtubule-associated protein Jupiter n=1 Tax=Caenorhabditis japonica TaxID=281687 RepID=A0A8R1DF96_CAEJA
MSAVDAAPAPAAPAPPTHAPQTPHKHCNTRDRLFGGQDAPAVSSPKRVTPTYKSQIFDDAPPASPQRTPKRAIPVVSRNPVTGEIKQSPSQQKIAA